MTETIFEKNVSEDYFEFLVWLMYHPLTWRRRDLWRVPQPTSRGRLRRFGFTLAELSSCPSLIQSMSGTSAQCSVFEHCQVWQHFKLLIINDDFLRPGSCTVFNSNGHKSDSAQGLKKSWIAVGYCMHQYWYYSQWHYDTLKDCSLEKPGSSTFMILNPFVYTIFYMQAHTKPKV